MTKRSCGWQKYYYPVSQYSQAEIGKALHPVWSPSRQQPRHLGSHWKCSSLQVLESGALRGKPKEVGSNSSPGDAMHAPAWEPLSSSDDVGNRWQRWRCFLREDPPWKFQQPIHSAPTPPNSPLLPTQKTIPEPVVCTPLSRLTLTPLPPCQQLSSVKL